MPHDPLALSRQGMRAVEARALREWRCKNGLPEIADPPLHWSDAQYTRLSHSRGRAVAVAEYAVQLFADLTREIVRTVRR